MADIQARRQAAEGKCFAVAHTAGGQNFAVEQLRVVGQRDFSGLPQSAALVQHQRMRQEKQPAARMEPDTGVQHRFAAFVHRQNAGKRLGVERERSRSGQFDFGVDGIARQQAGRRRHLHRVQRIAGSGQAQQL